MSIERKKSNTPSTHDFFRRTLHDAKTSAQIIMAYTELYQEDPKEKFKSIIFTETKNMAYFFEDVSRWWYVRSGEYELHFEKIDFIKFLNKLFNEVLENKSMTEFEYDLDFYEDEIFLKTDPDELADIIEILLDPTNLGLPVETSRTISLSVHNKKVILEILWPQTSLPPEVLKNVFCPFFQLKHRLGKDGFGLRLPIAREIMKVLKGKIHLQAHGDDLKFILALPAQARLKK